MNLEQAFSEEPCVSMHMQKKGKLHKESKGIQESFCMINISIQLIQKLLNMGFGLIQ